MSRPRRVIVATAVAVYTAAAAASGVLLMAANTGLDVEVLPYSFSFVAFSIVGGVIVIARPDNRIGWLLAAVGLLGGTALGTQEYARYSELAQPLPHATTAAWVGNWTFFPGMGLMMGVLPLIFPTGRVRSRRWAPLVAVALVTAAASALSGMFQAGPLDMYQEFTIENPLGFPALNPVLDIVNPATFLIFSVAGVAGVLSLILRSVRGSAEERQQIKWLLYVIGTAVPLLVLFETGVDATAFSDTVAGEAIHVLIASLLWLGVPAAVGMAVLKYRLYDIDVVISRTLVFGGLTAFITAVYVGIVVVVGSLLGAGDEPNLALSIVATAVVAVAFQPVRERLTRLANRLVFGKRATPYEVLSRFSEHLGEVAATEQTLERMARLLVEGTGAARAQVWLRTGGRLQPVATWPSHMTDGSDPEHLVDVTHEGQALGALSVDKQRGETLTPTDVKLVDDLASQAGLVLKNLRLTEELKRRIVDLQASRQRLVSAQDAERRRLERDLHDGAQRQLLELKSRLASAGSTATEEQAEKAAQILEQVTGDAGDAVATLRELAHGIYPSLLAAEGLAGALRAQAAKAAVPVVVHADRIGRYDPDVEAAVYFCVLEAVNNAAKYANPTTVTVRLAGTDGQLVFEVTDDGDGFDPDTTPRGHGTANMTDRLDALSGVLDITSAPGRGTTVRGRLAVLAPQPEVVT